MSAPLYPEHLPNRPFWAFSVGVLKIYDFLPRDMETQQPVPQFWLVFALCHVQIYHAFICGPIYIEVHPQMRDSELVHFNSVR